MARIAIVFCLLLAVVAAASKGKKPLALSGRIVGGKPTDISVVPYQVSLRYKSKHDCGGSIIGIKYVVTAAHCVYNTSKSDLTVRAGSNNHERGGETKKIKKITMHPNYNDDNLQNDIALLELQKPLTIGTNIKTISLTDKEPRLNEDVLISGWGALNEKQKTPVNILRSVTVKVSDWQTCKKVHMGRNRVTEEMFCAGVTEGGKDACQGDSGGPAVINGKLAGVISWGVGCGQKGSPGVYTNVFKYRDWIKSLTRSS